MYLSSYRLGRHHQQLLRLSGHGRRTALVPNALDGASDGYRGVGLSRDVDELEAAGLNVTVLDLRQRGGAEKLPDFDIVWVRGGNVFALRRALADTGADVVLTDLLGRDAVVYGGYSAGPCVLGPDLLPFARVDDINAVDDPITDGLGVLDRPLVPHVQSPEHPESAACDAIAAGYKAGGEKHWALRDGQVLLIDGDNATIM